MIGWTGQVAGMGRRKTVLHAYRKEEALKTHAQTEALYSQGSERNRTTWRAVHSWRGIAHTATPYNGGDFLCRRRRIHVGQPCSGKVCCRCYRLHGVPLAAL